MKNNFVASERRIKLANDTNFKVLNMKNKNDIVVLSTYKFQVGDIFYYNWTKVLEFKMDKKILDHLMFEWYLQFFKYNWIHNCCYENEKLL